jgi:type IV pilus biogenesis protein CpaD/CtpE
MATEELQTRLETTERDRVVFVDRYDDNEVWLSIQVPGGGANCTMTFEQAREMIASLNRILEAE